MKLLRYTILLAAVLASVASLVPRPILGDDWLPINPEDLALKDNPAQPGADAMILYRRSHIDAKRAKMDEDADEEYIRIKVFTIKGAKQETNQRIPFSKGNSDIKDVRARTIEPDGRIVNFDGKAFDDVYTTANSEFVVKSFVLSDVQPGCIIEYKYRHQYKNDVGSSVFYLHGQTWVISGRFFTRDASFSIDPYVSRSRFDPTLYFRTTGLPAGTLPQRQANGSYTMEVHNIPGVDDEPLMPPIRSLQARVEFFYRDSAQPSSETTEQYWNRNARKWSDDLDKFVSKRSILEADVARTITAADSPEVKLQKLYARAQQIRDLSYEAAKTGAERKAEGLKPNENVQDVLSRGYATGRQINWLFIGLVRTAGFEAFPVYLVQRNRDIFRPAGQDTSPLTADIVWVKAGGKEYWLDPAALYYPFGLLPWYETESKGVRASKDGAAFVDTPAASVSDAAITRHAEIQLKEDGSASGKLSVDFSGGPAALRRTWNRNQDEIGRKKTLEKEIQGWLPSGSTFELTTLTDWADTGKPLHVEGTVTVSGFGAMAGHRITIPATLCITPYRKTFEAEHRVNPIYFDFRWQQIDDLNVRAPDGYRIETLPPAKSLNPGASMSYEITPSQQGEALHVKRRMSVNDIHFGVDSYAAIRYFFNSVRTNDEAQVVIQHAETAKNN